MLGFRNHDNVANGDITQPACTLEPRHLQWCNLLVLQVPYGAWLMLGDTPEEGQIFGYSWAPDFFCRIFLGYLIYDIVSASRSATLHVVTRAVLLHACL